MTGCGVGLSSAKFVFVNRAGLMPERSAPLPTADVDTRAIKIPKARTIAIVKTSATVEHWAEDIAEKRHCRLVSLSDVTRYELFARLWN